MDRAIRMAEIDNEMGVQSSFFIQVMNSAYNPLSIENKNILKRFWILVTILVCTYILVI